MPKPRLKARFVFSLRLLALALLPLPVLSGELTLRPFSASYNLYQGGMHLAISELELERSGSEWRFRMLTRARGIYSMFTRKKPFAETAFSISDDDKLRLREIVIGDAGTEENQEAARFDWGDGKLDVMRKGKRKQLELEGDVYDYQSIHLLAASMGRQQSDYATFDFYRKGRLRKSHLAYAGEHSITVSDESKTARVYVLTTDKSSSKIKYYYDAENPLLLLRLEKLESGESPQIMTLRKVEWAL